VESYRVLYVPLMHSLWEDWGY